MSDQAEGPTLIAVAPDRIIVTLGWKIAVPPTSSNVETTFNDTEYIRADICAALQARVKELEADAAVWDKTSLVDIVKERDARRTQLNQKTAEVNMTDNTDPSLTETPMENTDVEIWREVADDFYASSIHVTEYGGIGINCGGTVYVKTIREWHGLAEKLNQKAALTETPKSLAAIKLKFLSGNDVQVDSARVSIEEWKAVLETIELFRTELNQKTAEYEDLCRSHAKLLCKYGDKTVEVEALTVNIKGMQKLVDKHLEENTRLRQEVEQCIVYTFERSAQICRYYLKHQNISAHEQSQYEKGVTVTCENLENLILLESKPE